MVIMAILGGEKTKPNKANFSKAGVTETVSCFILPIWSQNP